MEVELTRRRLDVARAYRELEDPESGGVVVFVGRVRPDRSERGTVAALWYEADERMATERFHSLVQQAHVRYQARRVVLWHRLGKLGVGEVSVVVGVAAGHRAEAFRGARFLIEGVKKRVPIWKSDWTPGAPETLRRPAGRSTRGPGPATPRRPRRNLVRPS
ncbi:MAG: molybdenum cofactor biosynthesis protein MoaE [Thermoplasmata archaeon]|nr:molybdenum cofactor biosynthesis protein MoaE [Thermoplasmata archaeon]